MVTGQPVQSQVDRERFGGGEDAGDAAAVLVAEALGEVVADPAVAWR